jgi:hypothetical protein
VQANASIRKQKRQRQGPRSAATAISIPINTGWCSM